MDKIWIESFILNSEATSEFCNIQIWRENSQDKFIRDHKFFNGEI